MADKDLIEWLGALLVLDDFKDLGRFDRLHHWLVGVAMLFKPEWFEELFD